MKICGIRGVFAFPVLTIHAQLWLLHLALLINSILSPNPMPPFGGIGAFYFQLMDQSQVWISIEPQTLEPGPNPVRLTVTASFPGLVLAHEPDSIELRAEAMSTAFPMRARQPIFRLLQDGGSETDLTAPGEPYQFFSSCQECAADTIVLRMPFSSFRRLAASNSLDIEVLGFNVKAGSTDMQDLRKFIDVVKGGVAIRWHQAWSF